MYPMLFNFDDNYDMGIDELIGVFTKLILHYDPLYIAQPKYKQNSLLNK